MDIILASQSPRRKALLERMGLTGFKTVSPGVDERLFKDLPPEELVRRLSAEKASSVAAHASPGALIIAADTVVSLDGAVLGKPADELDAFKMLSALSGVRHQVYTGVTVLRGEQRETDHVVTHVTFRELSEAELECYLKTGEYADKAGGYGIQGYGALLVEDISGDYFNVVGLPVCRLGRMLERFGVNCLYLASEK